MRAAIVIPTIREDSIRSFLAAWEARFQGHDVIVVEDNPTRSFDLPDWVTHVAWDDIDADLKGHSWIIPRRTGAIRSYGTLLAGRRNVDMIVMLDDDCLPHDGYGFLERHWDALRTPGVRDPFYDTLSPLQNGLLDVHARGYPREERHIRTVVNHGLWNNIPDLDGETQLRHPTLRSNFPDHSIQVPRGTLFPLCAMNVAFRPEILPAMYQIPMGQGQPFHRFDDIWCGWIMKRACDVMGLSVRSGTPFIEHTRASNAERNRTLERPGIAENENVWRAVADSSPTSHSLHTCLADIHKDLGYLGDYWKWVGKAAQTWRSLVHDALSLHGAVYREVA